MNAVSTTKAEPTPHKLDLRQRQPTNFNVLYACQPGLGACGEAAWLAAAPHHAAAMQQQV